MSRRRTFNDPALDGKDTDIVILVMGATGAGRSTFINYILGEDRMEVGHQLTSCTVDLAPAVVKPPKLPRNLKDHRVVIVDTPGFDNIHAADVEILRRIVAWLEESYRKKMVLGGVIYLHDISQDRLTNSASKNLTMFNHLCGDASLEKVILLTTKWEKFRNVQRAESRETELKQVHWNYMIERGTEVRQFTTKRSKEEGKRSAWEIIDVILGRVSKEKEQGKKGTGPQIQREPVDPETGEQLCYSRQKFAKMRKQMTELEAELTRNGAITSLEEIEETIQRLQDQMQSLKVSLRQRT